MQARWDRSHHARFAAPQVHAARRHDCRARQRGRPMTTTSHPGGFPDGFLWGASTAAFQIEVRGAFDLDGRGRGTPEEAVRETARMGGRRHRPSSLAGTAIAPPYRMN